MSNHPSYLGHLQLGEGFIQSKAVYEVDAVRDHMTPASETRSAEKQLIE